MERNRSAPFDWGPWPPTQQRVNDVVERACRALAKQISDEPWIRGTILMAQPCDVDQLDCSFTGREREVQVGHIRAIAQHKGWQVFWDPANDTGRLSSLGHYDWRA